MHPLHSTTLGFKYTRINYRILKDSQKLKNMWNYLIFICRACRLSMFGIIRIVNLKASSILSHRVYNFCVPLGGSLASCCWMVESNRLTSCCDLLEKGLFQFACIHSLAAPPSCNLWTCNFFNPWEWVVGIASDFCGLQSDKDSLKLKSLKLNILQVQVQWRR